MACCTASHWTAARCARTTGCRRRRCASSGWGRTTSRRAGAPRSALGVAPVPVRRPRVGAQARAGGAGGVRVGARGAAGRAARHRRRPSARARRRRHRPRGAAARRAREAARVRTLFAQATCFVMPSEVEPFGLAYIEAAAAGAPSIATSVGGAATIVAEGTGLLVAPGDGPALLAAMRTLADGEVARRMGEARASARGCSRGSASAARLLRRARPARRGGGGVPVTWAVCLLNWNGREDTLRCLAALAGVRGEFATVVADNGSTDGSVEAIRARVPGRRADRERRQPRLLGRQQRRHPARARARRRVGRAAQQRRRARARDARGAAGRRRAPPAGAACSPASCCSRTAACSGRASAWRCSRATPAARAATGAPTASRTRSRAAPTARSAR